MIHYTFTTIMNMISIFKIILKSKYFLNLFRIYYHRVHFD